MIELLLIFLACHFIADFPFQGDWLGLNKGKSWELMIYHCLIYAGTFVVFAHATPIAFSILFISHLVIDPLKARYKIIKQIWVDQLLHISVVAIIVLFKI